MRHVTFHRKIPRKNVEPPSGFEHETPGLVIVCPNHSAIVLRQQSFLSKYFVFKKISVSLQNDCEKVHG